MLTRLRISRFGVALTLVLALCLALVGFAHHVPTARAAQAEAILLSGHSLSDICGDAAGEDHSGTHCPACQLTGGAILPDPAGAVQDAGWHLVAEITAPRENRVALRVRDPARGTRAPPLL